jgi:hypothetical protein
VLKVSVFVLGLMSMSACIRGEPLPPIGVTYGGGSIGILYEGCKDEQVLEVSVKEVLPTDSGGIVTGPVHWRIRSDEGLELDRFSVGVTPPGFREVVPSERVLPVDLDLAISIVTTRSQGSTGVRLDETKPGLVSYGGKNVSVEEFERQTGDC